MADYTLTAKSPLEGHRKTFSNTDLCEVTELAIISLAIPEGGETAFAEKILDAYSCKVPTAGRYCRSSNTDTRLLWMQRDQFFLVSEYSGHDMLNQVKEKLGGTAYLSEQSDSWVLLRLKGPQSRMALERICPLDLHAVSFPADAISRTVMEHMAAIILKEGENSFLLMGMRSSAQSFLHALETSLENVSE